MKDDNPRDSRQLRTLERWRSVELEAAQAQHATLARVTTQKASAVNRVESDIADTQTFARDQLLAGGPLSPEMLRGSLAFTALKEKELIEAQAALEESRASSDAAHASVVEHFEQLSVVEKLRERRAAETVKELARLAQKRLDEHALSRLAGGCRTNQTATDQE
jgi:hypothetical protein